MSFVRDEFPHMSALAEKGLRAVLQLQPQCQLSFIAFDLGAGGSVAFVTTYPESSVLVEIVHELLKRWENPPKKRIYTAAEVGWLPGLPEIQAYTRAIERAIPGTGYVLLAGTGKVTQYVSNGDREGIAQMLREEVLPGLIGDMA